jgi:RNase P/RNase MRP subunit p30
MKRLYADLHLCPNVIDKKQTAQAIAKASSLGYRLIAVSLPLKTEDKEIKELQSLCKTVGVDFASRIDLRPRTPDELLKNLRRFRRKFEIIAVVCESKNVARQAAKDRRVDLLNYPSPDYRKSFFDEAEAELASNSLASLEIDTNHLLILEGRARIKLMSSLRKETAVARQFHVPIIVSSGVSDGKLMRKPAEMASLASLFNLSQVFALDAVSTNPVAMVKRNREKLDARFVAPGIRIVRGGKDF